MHKRKLFVKFLFYTWNLFYLNRKVFIYKETTEIVNSNNPFSYYVPTYFSENSDRQ